MIEPETPDIPFWEVTRTWYVWGIDSAHAAVDLTKEMPHQVTQARRVTPPAHEESIIPWSQQRVCARDGHDWPCVAALTQGIEP